MGYKPNHNILRPYYCSAGKFSASILGLGHFSQSRIFGRLGYETASATVDFDPDAAMFSGRRLSLRREMTHYVINRISCDRAVSKSRFKTIFGVPLTRVFPETIKGLERLGQVEVGKDAVRFLAKSTKELYICSRLFLDRRTMLTSLARQYRCRAQARSG
jgi:hypothetical protein